VSRERSDINSTLLLLRASQGGGREKEGRKEGGTEGGSKPKVGTFLDAGNPSTRRKETKKEIGDQQVWCLCMVGGDFKCVCG